MGQLIVVITGASSGIGACLAETVAAGGACPVLVARRRPELERVAVRCGGDALTVVADVTRREQVDEVLRATLERFGRVDVWVNNAGRGITRLVSELTDEDLDDMMLVNLKSALYGMQAVLPHFRERGAGHIINVSSMLGRIPYIASRSAYSAAKHALNALTASLRLELQTEYPGIVVSSVLPGVVATEFGIHALHGGFDSRTLPGAQTPLQVAEVIADVIRTKRADAYTRPGAQKQVVDYYAADDMAAVEAGFASRPSPPAPQG